MSENFIEKLNYFVIKNKLLFILMCIVLLFLRRPSDFFHPYVWCEDATWNIAQYVKFGFGSIFQPVQGYLVIPTKLINIISLNLSFLYYPEISLFFSVMFSVFCLLMIAHSPTVLKYRGLCALAVIFIPTDPEVFVLPLYSLWWGTLFLFLALLWEDEKNVSWVRIFFAVLGALSTPIVILTSLLFLLRYIFNRTAINLFYTILIFILAAVQAYFFLSTAHTAPFDLYDFLIHIPEIFNKFLVQFFIKHTSIKTGIIFSLFMVPGFVFLILQQRKKLDYNFILLLGLLLLSILSAIARVPVSVMDPYDAGPRYFFYPYILLSWILLLLLNLYYNQKTIRYLLIILIASAFVNSILKFSRNSTSPNWREHIEMCLTNETYDIPINSDGNLENVWFLSFDKMKCRNLVDQSLLDKYLAGTPKINTNVWFGFGSATDVRSELISLTPLAGTWQSGSLPVDLDADKSKLLSSWVGSDMFTGKQRLEFIANADRSVISYVTGPIAQRQIFLISEKKTLKTILSIPLKKSESLNTISIATEVGKEYEILISDNGDGWGEWSAVYIP